MAKDAKQYKFVGNHAQDLADGRMFAPGETVSLSDEQIADPHNAALIADEVLIPTDDEEAVEAKASPAAIELASERGVNLRAVTGTGAGGNITKEDVERHLDETGGES